MEMDLPTYIRQRGIDSSAALFGVSRHTTHSWLYEQRKPRPTKAAEIERKTEGVVTMREIFPEP